MSDKSSSPSATYGRLTPEMEKKQAAFLIERLNLLQLYTPQDQNTLGETLEFLKRFAASERGEFEVLRVERDKARAMYERAISHLTRIHAFLNPPIVEVGGKTYRFNNPDANETLQALSDAIRAIPEDLRSVPSAIREKFIRCVWVVERQFGYGKAMRVVASDHPRFSVGTRFDFGFLDIATKEGYLVQIDPVPPHVIHDMEEARRERKRTV